MMKKNNAARSRFFALTPERLGAITEHRLTRSEILVWAEVETKAAPGRARVFNLESVAQALRIGVDSVRRALRRLIGLGLIEGVFEGNRHHLSPAGRAQADMVHTTEREPCTSARLPRENLAPVLGCDAGNQAVTGDSGCHIEHVSEKKLVGKTSFEPTVRQLTQGWGLYPAVARALVSRFGIERVTQVMAWGAWLKNQGKIRSLGWLHQALVGGWVVPDGFQREQQTSGDVTAQRRPAPAPVQSHQVAQVETFEDKLETVRQMCLSTVPAVRRLGERFRVEWGLA
jgi:hypothetical protein